MTGMLPTVEKARRHSAGQVRSALDQGRLEVHYQPVVFVPSAHVVGFEALARLRTTTGRLVLPSEFVPVAESSGLIVPLGLAVLQRAVAAAAVWRASTGPLATATVSVNVAPKQLLDPGFLDVVTALLAEHDVPGPAVILEITESAATSARARPLLDRLSAVGIRIALDDFGVGFATLDNVRRLPVQVLKLDRSFVAGVTHAGADRAIARLVVDLADSLGLSVIAEGVETAEQAEALVRLGCPVAQGFLFGEPQADPERAAAAVLAGRGPGALAPGEELAGWTVELDTAVIAAARLLSIGPDGAERAALHAIATGLARSVGMSEAGVRTVGRLALVHDLARLTVDGVLPGLLSAVPQLRDLTEAEPGSAAPRLESGIEAGIEARLEVAIVRAARATVRREPFPDPRLAAALAGVSANPPDVVPLGEVIEDLDRRRVGRRGFEERLRSLVGISRVLASSRDSLELMRVALEEVRRIVGAASASLERWDRDACRLTTLVNVGQLGPGEEMFPTDEVYQLAVHAQARHTLLGGLPFIYTVDDPNAPVEAVELLLQLHKYSSAAVPVYLDGRMWGQIWLTTGVGEPPFAAADIETLTAVATLLGGVVAQAENLDRIGRMAFEDPLTRVANRRAVDDVLDRLGAERTSVTIALLDVDLLRTLNETAGYARGDRALVDLAEALSLALMLWPGSTVGRLGGDEFCVVLPGAARADAERVVADAQRRLREGVSGLRVSVGYASASPDWTPRDLLAAADLELYAAKGTARARR